MNFLAPIPNPQGPWQNAAGARFSIFGGTTLATSAPVTAAASAAAYAASQGLTPVNPPAPPTPQQTFDAAVEAGYTVPGITPPLVLDLSAEARNQFLGLGYLLDKQLAVGRITAADQVPFTDIKGAPQSLSVANVQTMILGYGEYFAGLFAALHAAAPATTPPAN